MLRVRGQNVWIWGNPTWGVLEADALASDLENAEQDTKGDDSSADLVRCFNEVAPCMFCEDSMRLFVPQIEEESGASLEAMASTGRSVEMVHALHEKVNQKLWAHHIDKSLMPLLRAIEGHVSCSKDTCVDFARDFVADMHLFRPRSISLELFRRRLEVGISGRFDPIALGTLSMAVAISTPIGDAEFNAQRNAKLLAFFKALAVSTDRVARVWKDSHAARAAEAIRKHMMPCLTTSPKASLVLSGGSLVLEQKQEFDVDRIKEASARLFLDIAPAPVSLRREPSPNPKAMVALMEKQLSVKRCAVDTCA